ncbi:hypothetical protein AG1IA_04133 [Rhizoctonia solani AG-1 IA]|uniref:Uncharacterized protein n=1 Tax=Thanatephorus cucumeris (strain AG1-IA) TaxID=983506 RepID=L8WYJ2_THACA|nr:hypothetical protein AG1IA_04133 [Rhizoctonia solani AG-1 IA]
MHISSSSYHLAPSNAFLLYLDMARSINLYSYFVEPMARLRIIWSMYARLLSLNQ